MESIHLNQLKYYVQGFSRGHSEQMFSRNELPSAQMICSEYMNLNILLVRTALALLRSKEHVLQTGCDRTAVRSFGENSSKHTENLSAKRRQLDRGTSSLAHDVTKDRTTKKLRRFCFLSTFFCFTSVTLRSFIFYSCDKLRNNCCAPSALRAPSDGSLERINILVGLLFKRPG